MPTSNRLEGVHLGGGKYAAWNAQRVVLFSASHTEAPQSIVLEPEELGKFMDWLHDIIQSNPEGTVFTRDDAP